MAKVWSSEISIWVSIPVRGGKRNGRTGGTNVLGRGDDKVWFCAMASEKPIRSASRVRGITRVLLPRNAWVEERHSNRKRHPNRKRSRAWYRACERICGTSATASY